MQHPIIIGGVRRHGEKRNCHYCGNKTLNKKYCSRECQSNNEHDIRIHNWKQGTDTISDVTAKRYLKSKNDACWCCGIVDWNNKPIILEIEHIDGNGDNNEESNLSLLCPNCHSQTDTYKAKNTGNGRHYRRQRYKEGKSY